MAAPASAARTSPLLTPPQQARSRRSLEKLVAAGLAVLAAEGSESVTVAAVTKRARVSVGSFYARFQGKEDFLRHLGEEALERTRSTWAESRESGAKTLTSHDTALRDRVEWVVNALATLFREGPGAVVLGLNGVDDPGPTRVSRVEAFLAEELESTLGAPPAKARIAAQTALALLGTPKNEAAPPSEEDEAAYELTNLLTAYLTPGFPGGANEPDPDPFDVWG